MSSSSRSSSSYQQKSVNFAPAVRVHLTVGRWELSPEEHYRVWTSSHDTKKSQDGILDSVRHMRKFVMADGELSPDCESTLLANNRTSRGCEHMRSRESIAARRQIKLDVVDAVLEEQHRQRCEGVDNPVTIAEASMLVSKRCRTKAAVKGGQDAAMARVLNRRDSNSSSSSADKSAVVKKQQTTTHHRSSSSKHNTTGTTTMTITNTAAVSRYSTTTFDVVGEEDASVTAVVDPAGLTAVSLHEGKNGSGHHSTSREERVESDTMFSNISHKRLRDKLMQRVSGLALGA